MQNWLTEVDRTEMKWGVVGALCYNESASRQSWGLCFGSGAADGPNTLAHHVGHFTVQVIWGEGREMENR